MLVVALGRCHRGWRIAPPRIPTEALKANTTPTGIEIDWKNRKFKDTGAAFCTATIAIVLIQAATNILTIELGTIFISIGLSLIW
ncbi:hypothetical protein BCD67_12975 [Oscillatoriales cyanobacterium USR001]|nr:hypothetical protein BCD67_12975 [Oscillatoriales cyanobacterium USR001]